VLPRNILVPTDFSETAEQALDYAVELGAKLDAKIHLLNVITMPALSTLDAGLELTPVLLDSLQEESQKALDQLIRARKDKVAFGPPLVELGEPRSVIDETAKRLGVDLIVLGTHGRRGFSRLILGSVAEAVVRSAPCPVLAVRPKLESR
jgi:universal stress protein A